MIWLTLNCIINVLKCEHMETFHFCFLTSKTETENSHFYCLVSDKGIKRINLCHSISIIRTFNERKINKEKKIRKYQRVHDLYLT